jgi:RNA polymerase sigma-70 factor (ECF subfamily)
MIAAESASTADLLARARSGDTLAREDLLRRYLPLLRTWAHGRLPDGARGAGDTDDLVQVTLLRALDHLQAFEPRREGAFLAYLRSILLNALRDQVRRSHYGPGRAGPLPLELPDQRPSILEETIGRETIERYEAALVQLTPLQREAVILRVEFGFSHQEIAGAIGCPSANAARMQVTRGLVRLGQLLGEEPAPE